MATMHMPRRTRRGCRGRRRSRTPNLGHTNDSNNNNNNSNNNNNNTSKNNKNNYRPMSLVLGPCADFVVSMTTAVSMAIDGVARNADAGSAFLVNRVRMLRREAKLGDMHLGSDAREVLSTPNAGGNSVASEVLSCELLTRIAGARLLATEMSVEYSGACSMTDYVVSVGGVSLGVSVTRAFNGHPFHSSFTRWHADRLLRKKLSGCVSATFGAVRPTWTRQVLHVWVRDSEAAGLVEEAWRDAGDGVRANTVVLVTVVDDGAEFLF